MFNLTSSLSPIHFLECYRDELASYASPTNPMAFHAVPCVDVEHEILSSGYDEETVYRVCVFCTICSNTSSIVTLTSPLSVAGPTICSIFTMSVDADSR